MNFRRIGAIILMHGEEFFDKAELLEILYWWVCDMVFLGFLGKSFSKLAENNLFGTLIIISFIAVRTTVARNSIIMARLLIYELSERTFVSTLATPLTQKEFIVARMIIGCLQALMRLCLGYTLIFLFFGINIFKLGSSLFICLPFLIVSGWVLGLLTSSFVYVFGKQCQMLIQAFSFTFMALCGVYAPVSTLPTFFQHVAHYLPTTYILTGLRENLTNGTPLWPFLLKNIVLNFAYTLVALPLLYWSFRHVKEQGFASLENR